VLGSSTAVQDADWDANIVAVPSEHVDLLESLAKVSGGSAAA
jgi:hypothetical protein